MNKLQGRVALVTSATRGIGLASARALAAAGAHVFLGARRMDAAEALCKEGPGHMEPVFFDALQKNCYAPMVDSVVQKAGRLDILVNNFGTGQPATDLDLLNGSENTFFELLDLNLGSVYRICRLAMPHLLESGAGSIVNISSIGGAIPDVTRLGYGVSKAAINNLTQQIALQYARAGVRCNAILPGLTATDAALGNLPPEFLQSFLAHVPLGRIGTPEDIANAVLFFAGDASAYVTGHILEVAGGYGLGTPQYGDWLRQA